MQKLVAKVTNDNHKQQIITSSCKLIGYKSQFSSNDVS